MYTSYRFCGWLKRLAVLGCIKRSPLYFGYNELLKIAGKIGGKAETLCIKIDPPTPSILPSLYLLSIDSQTETL